MTEERKFKLKHLLSDYLIITMGMTLYVLSWTLFLIPAEITGGGISGLSAVIFYSTKFPIAISYFIINIFLILAAIKILGASFGIKTIWSMLVATTLFWITPGMLKEPLINDTFLSAVLGAMMGGFGIGLVFTRGGSTGGTDIIAMIINKYRNVSPGRVIMYCDVIIIASSYFVFHSPAKLVYGYVTMWVLSYSIDAFLNGANASAQIFIFSKKFNEVADHINLYAGRGVTIMDGTGWYTKENVKIVMTVVRKREASMVFRKLKEIDPDAFISMGSVMGVYGKGFENIKI
ncbi:YitT family protein [Mangrovibacterium lignilyticum]|uniref:YitT family protein n=1 Tax=Mangrovibacterium lignilyticum TaxID=2668052 RepID=UPI0013D849D4|nr:YitT family protein [Mangrovibacterium lignilyticum]